MVTHRTVNHWPGGVGGITHWPRHGDPNALSGTASMDFLLTGTLTGVGALSGTAAMAFATSGTMSAPGALSGSADMAFGSDATLTGPGNMSGTAAMSFGGSGTLTDVGGNLGGHADMVFASSATLTGVGALSGTASMNFGSSATLAGTGALSGTAAMVFASSSTLTGPGALSGTAAMAFAPSGTLTNAVSDPATIFGANLIAWYRTDSLTQAAGVVSQATDKSGNGNHLTAAGAAQPSYSASGGPNSVPLVTHTSSQILNKTSGFTGFPGSGGVLTIFAVLKATGNNSGDMMVLDIDGGVRLSWDVGGTDIGYRYAAGTSNAYTATAYGTTYHKFILYQTSANAFVREDSSQKVSDTRTTFGATSIAEIIIGNAATQAWVEFGVVTGNITLANATDFEAYSTSRYGV